jgi:aromatic-L-amino-acid/L-tryptophan decarboxylase
MNDAIRTLAAEKTSTVSRDMPAEEFERCGQALIEWISGYLEHPAQYPVLARCQPGELLRQLPTAGPVKGASMKAILEDFERMILPSVTHWNHPGFFGYFSRAASAPGVLGELLTAALDVNAMLWKSCPAATELEQVTARWVLDWLNLPSDWFGMLVDSASSSALQAIVAARQRAEPESRAAGPSGRLVAYLSEHTHSSVEKAAIAAGIGQSNIRHIAVDAGFRMRTGALAQAVQADRAKNLRPFFAVGTVGTTSSTAVDPIAEIAGICRENGLWFHVDGAYAGSFAIVPECRHLLEGVEQADSFVVNPHKMMMVPLDCSLFYTRHPKLLRNAFALEAEYLKTEASGALDYTDYGLALGRRFRALKLWFVMRYFGREGLAAILRERLRMAAWLGQKISDDDRFDLLAPATMGLVCFRLRQGDAATRELMSRINSSGRFFVSHTVLGGHFTIRVAIGNLRMQQQDVEKLWTAIAEG